MGSLQLIKESQTFRVDTEAQAMELIEDAKEKQNTGGYTVKESKYQLKQKKAKGEVIDEFFLVTITKSFE